MKLIYGLISLISLLYIVLKHRKIDFFTIYIFSILIYYFPAYLGIIYRGHLDYINIETNTYVLLSVNLFVILWIVILYDAFKTKKYIVKNFEYKDDIYYNKAIFFISLCSLILNLFCFFKYGNLGTDSFNKVQLLENSSRLVEYTKYLDLFIFVYAFTNRGKFINYIRIISVFCILCTFMLGHRSFLVIGIIGILYNYITQKCDFKSVLDFIKKNKRIVIGILIFMFVTFFVKNVFAALVNKDFELVKARLSSGEYYIETLLKSEPNTITNNLNNVVKYGMKYNIMSYLMTTTICLIPYFGNIIMKNLNLKTFEHILQINFNDRIHEGIGLGSTFIGETYATGGIVFLALMGMFICLLIIIIEKKVYKTKNPALRCWMIIFLTYLTFYINRNSLVFIFVAARAYLYIMTLVILVKFFVKIMHKNFIGIR